MVHQFALLCFLLGVFPSVLDAVKRAPDELPTIQVRLAPPTNALPEVSAEVMKLDHDRERAESAMVQQLRAAYDSALKDAEYRIDSLVKVALGTTSAGSALPVLKSRVSFLQRRDRKQRTVSSGDDFAINLNLVPVPPPDPSIQKEIEQIESARDASEQLMFSEARAEMQGLTSIVVDELGRALSAHLEKLRRVVALRKTGSAKLVSFLQLSRSTHVGRNTGLPQQANLRISSSDDAFPKISQLVQDMELRRDNAEREERVSILDMELTLLKAEHDMIKAALRRVVG